MRLLRKEKEIMMSINGNFFARVTFPFMSELSVTSSRHVDWHVVTCTSYVM